MANKKIDLSDIKESDIDKTSTFSDLMSRSERRSYINQDKETKEIKKKINKEEIKIKEEIIKEDNFLLNVLGIFNILSIGFYLYLLLFVDKSIDYDDMIILSSLNIANIFIYGIAATSRKKGKNFFSILNILTILAFVLYNVYIFFY